MDWIINLGARISGIWLTVAELLPLLGAAGSILVTLGGIALRAAGAHDASDLLHALKPTSVESASLAVSVGLIKAYFAHQQHAIAIEALKAPQPQDGKTI